MRSGVPLVPTLMVLVSVPILIGFGVWQLQRMQWKEALLADLARNASAPLLDIEKGQLPDDAQFRRVRVALACDAGNSAPRAGRSLSGETGYSHRASCRAGETAMTLDIGWSRRPDPVPVPADPGRVDGILVRTGSGDWLLVNAAAAPPLAPSAAPSLDTISNSHFSYAMQWFGFAAILSAVYALFVRRWRAEPVAQAPGEA